MLEQEERFEINNEQLIKVLEVTEPYIKNMETLDVSFYENGKNLYDLYKYIIRIRQKGNKTTLEIKKYEDNDSTCLEGSINLDSISSAVKFLALLNLQPGLYLKRDREVRKYKSLDIFIDKFDVIGNYVEIEYQNSTNALEEMTEFKNICNITGYPEDMYGAIIEKKLHSDPEFKKNYDKKMTEVLENL